MHYHTFARLGYAVRGEDLTDWVVTIPSQKHKWCRLNITHTPSYAKKMVQTFLTMFIKADLNICASAVEIA